VLDLSCVEYVVDNRSETAQLPESGIVKFMLDPLRQLAERILS
jgi:hypothetical protein